MFLESPYDYERFYAIHSEIMRSSKVYTLNLLPRENHLKVLDIGCGTGINSLIIRDLGHEVVGLELSKAALRAYLDKGFEGLNADIETNLPFLDDVFDLIFASEVIEHIFNFELLLNEAFRVLKPGGILILSTPNSYFWVYRILYFFGKTAKELQHPDHVQFFNKKKLSNYIKSAGFRKFSVSGRHMYMLFGDRIGRFIKILFPKLNIEKEFRVRTGKYFWHINKYASKASGWWADTLIIKAEKA